MRLGLLDSPGRGEVGRGNFQSQDITPNFYPPHMDIVLGLDNLTVNEAKNGIPPSELTFYLVGDNSVKKKTSKYAIQFLVIKKTQVR